MIGPRLSETELHLNSHTLGLHTALGVVHPNVPVRCSTLLTPSAYTTAGAREWDTPSLQMGARAALGTKLAKSSLHWIPAPTSIELHVEQHTFVLFAPTRLYGGAHPIKKFIGVRG